MKTRLLYVVLFFLSVILCWVFINFGPVWYDKIPSYIFDKKFCYSEGHHCFGAITVYRISFGLALFFAAQSIMMLRVKRTSDCRAMIQNGFWLFKIVALIGLIVAAFFIPMGFYLYYGYLALVASIVFLFFQLILLVDFAHSWTESWLRKWNEEEENKIWFQLLVVSAIALYLLALCMIITMYALFTTHVDETMDGGCSLNTVFITVALLSSIFISCLALHPKIQQASPQSGLLQPAVVSVYMIYLVWSAIMSEPADGPLGGCNNIPLTSGAVGTGSQKTSVIMGAILVMVAVCYSALRASSQHDTLFSGGADEETGLVSDSINDVAAAVDGEESEVAAVEESNADEPVRYNYSFFHFIFTLAAMYICMLMTNWQVVKSQAPADINMGATITIDQSMASVWIKVASSWLVGLLFSWSLIAPVLMPNREF